MNPIAPSRSQLQYNADTCFAPASPSHSHMRSMAAQRTSRPNCREPSAHGEVTLRLALIQPSVVGLFRLRGWCAGTASTSIAKPPREEFYRSVSWGCQPEQRTFNRRLPSSFSDWYTLEHYHANSRDLSRQDAPAVRRFAHRGHYPAPRVLRDHLCRRAVIRVRWTRG